MCPSAERPLRSPSYEVADAVLANELFQANGWTDGLPVLPPTEAAVRRCLEAAQCAPDDVVGTEPVRRRRITAEKVAIAAVMAGCRPEYTPVVLAIVRAMCEPEFGLHGSHREHGGSAPFVVVNGPVRGAIGMNATHNVLANGSRANATIGRSLRLLIINGWAASPASSTGRPSVIPASSRSASPRTRRTARGSPWPRSVVCRRGMSAVTVMAAESPHQVMNEWTRDPARSSRPTRPRCARTC